MYHEASHTVLIGLIFVFMELHLVEGWSNEELELYDLVEEVQQNFYELFEVAQDAEVSQIKRAYRRLSLKYHPDKYKGDDADVKFRQIAAIYELLKNEELRQKYNDVLEFGLPDWRQPVFYFRTVRKMPWWESVLLLVLIITVGQYLMLWGAYFEQKLTLSDALGPKMRKEAKKLRKQNIDVEDMIEQKVAEQLEKPSYSQLLPLAFSRWFSSFIINLPSTIINYIDSLKAKPQTETSDEEEVKRYIRPTVRIEDVEYDVATDITPVSTMGESHQDSDTEKDCPQHSNARSAWTVDEISLLVRLSTSKFPVGTVNRWEKIADALGRLPDEVTNMIGKLKHIDQKEYHKLCDAGGSKNEGPGQEISQIDDSDAWTQTDQRLFETALKQFPKSAEERWEKVAKCVPGKTKEQCMQRFKQLAQLVRQRKQVPASEKR